MSQIFSVSLLSLVLIFLGSTGSDAITVNPSRSYYSTLNDVLELNCGQQAFNNKTEVTYFANDQKTAFYNSSLKVQTSNWVKGVKDKNQTIIMNTKVISAGLWNLYCMVNKTQSTNKLTIPYIDGPRFASTPSGFALNKNYTFTCNGSMSPKVGSMLINFMYSTTANTNQVIGTVNNGVFTPGNRIPGILVAAVKGSNNSISFSPTMANTTGVYQCRFQITLNGQTFPLISVNGWNTNGVERLGSQILLISAGFFTVFFSNKFL